MNRGIKIQTQKKATFYKTRCGSSSLAIILYHVRNAMKSFPALCIRLSYLIKNQHLKWSHKMVDDTIKAAFNAMSPSWYPMSYNSTAVVRRKIDIMVNTMRHEGE